MKKTIFTTALAAMGFAACSQQANEARVSGHLDGIESDSLLVYAINTDFSREMKCIDTVPITNGDFSVVWTEKEVATLLLTPQPAPGVKPLSDGKYINFLMLPGESVTVKGNLKEFILTGSAYHAEEDKYTESVKPLNDKVNAIYAQMGSATTEQQDSLQAEIEKIYGELNKANLDYIKKNPDSDLSATIAAGMLFDTEEGINLLTERVRNGVMKPMIDNMLKMREEDLKTKEAAGKIVPGAEAPDFTLMDVNGKPLALSGLRGKYVVLDFWGSWCGWCIKGFPEMKKYYEKYKAKVEFLGIACGDTEEKWKGALEKHDAPWLHVINSKEEGKDVSVMYGISGYPTKIVIDAEGKIAKVVVGESPEFYEYLDELFK